MLVRAAVMPGPGEPIRIDELEAPEIEKGGALLRTTFSEVCGTDVHLADGRLAGVPYPIIPGHVSVGVLEAIHGTLLDVDGKPFAEGDEVAFLDVHGSCGACFHCAVAKASTRCPQRKVYGITFGVADGLHGGWADKIVLRPGTKVLRLPRDLDAETYIGGGCGLNTALAAMDRAEVRLGDVVTILGAGPVGQSITAFATLAGAGERMVIGAPDDRLEFAKRMGASATHGLGDPEARIQWVRDRTNGRGADIVIEAAGDPRAVVEALEMVRDGGRVVVSGQYTDHGDVSINPHRLINQKHVEIRGSWGSDFSHFFRSIDVMSRHHDRFPWRDMITRCYPLKEAAAALEAVRRREVVKAAIAPSTE